SPNCASVASMASAAPGTTRGVSRSSMRISQVPRCARACSQLATAASSDPWCRSPFGEGAKRPRPGATLLAVAVVPIAVLLFTTFAALLRLDRQRGHGPGLQPLHADLFAGLEAVAVAAILDAGQRLVDLADQLALAIARAQLEAEFLFLRGAVVRIREVGRFVLHVRDGAVDLEHQVALPAEQDGAEVLQLLLAHVLLAALDDVRLYIARTRQQRVADLCVVARVIGAGAGYGRERLVGWHSYGGILGFMDGAWRRGRFGGCSHRPANRCGFGWFFRGRRLLGGLRATRGNSP